MKTPIATTAAPGAIGPYSQAIDTGSFVFISGQIPVNPATGEVPEGIKAQAAQSIANIKAILAEAGMKFMHKNLPHHSLLVRQLLCVNCQNKFL